MQTLHEQEPVETTLRPENQIQQSEPARVSEQAMPLNLRRKRIVSKSAYVQAQADRAFMGLLGAGLWFSTGFVALITVGCLVITCICLSQKSFQGAGGSLLVALLSALFARMCRRMASEAMQALRAIAPGVPLTRANTPDLPAPESLVRASAEPRQAQETVLLRAATEEQQTPSEQLVRAVGGQE